MIWGVPKKVVPQYGWFIMENTIKMDDLEVPPFKQISIWCVMMTYTKTALVILGGAFVGLSGHDCHGFCGKKHPMQTLPSSNTTPTKRQKKTSNNDQQKTQQFRKAWIFFSNKFFTSLLNLCGFPRFFGSTTKRDMSARANWFTATISIRRVSPLSSKTSQVRTHEVSPRQENRWGY